MTVNNTEIYNKTAGQRGHCMMCGAFLPDEPAFSVEDMPASAQDIPASPSDAADSGIMLELKCCPECGMWQMDTEPVDYYRDVIRATGLSEAMRELRRSDYRHMIDKYNLMGGKFIECGCGHGEFLEVLREFPVRIFGTEHSHEAAKEAAERLNAPLDGEIEALNIGPCEVLDLFPDTEETDIPGAPFDCFLSFNFLEHQPDPGAMLGCMFRNLRRGGYGLITVPSFEYILEGGRYYELIRDHIACYTMDTLKKLCRECGFEVIEEERIGIGDTLRVVVKKPAKGRASNALSDDELIRRLTYADTSGLIPGGENDGPSWKWQLETEDIITGLEESFDELSLRIADYVDSLREENRTLALWGAGHQGFTIAATTALGEYAEYMVDSSPIKQGKFAPVSALPIVSPEHLKEQPVDVVMITAPGYTGEIEKAILRLREGGSQDSDTAEETSVTGRRLQDVKINDILTFTER